MPEPSPSVPRPSDWTETPPLEDFRRWYAEYDNIWWLTDCGHHLNLFEAACDEIDRLRALLEQNEQGQGAPDA